MPLPLRQLVVPALLAACAGCGDGGEPREPQRGAEPDADAQGGARADDPPVAVQPVAADGAQERALDPREWVPLDEFQGVPVETRRAYHPDGGLEQIRTVDPTKIGPEGFHGPELAYFQNGVMRSRQTWVRGRLEGESTFWYFAGTLRWRCTFLAGERDGVYEEYHKNGDPKARFEYDAGVAHGAFREWFIENEPHTESHWEHGVQVGVHRQWSRGEKLALEEHYEAGERHGPYKQFAPDGTLEREGEFVRGERDGLWSRYAEGQLVATETWRAGEQHGPAVEYLGGAKAVVTTFVDGVETGTRTLYFSDGSRRAEGSMLAGKREGRWTYWKSDGTINEAWSGLYVNDEKVGD
jgi:antitoxin component YwqK of YwqJK toxin-antitoxin module